MMKYDSLYRQCKNFVDEFEKCEKNIITNIASHIKEGEDKETIKDTIDFNTLFESCQPYAIILQTSIVTDFITRLDDDLKENILLSLHNKNKSGD